MSYKTAPWVLSASCFFIACFTSLGLCQNEVQDPYLLQEKTITLYSQGLYDEAISCARQMADICQNTLGVFHPGTANSLQILAELYRIKKEYYKAESFYKEVLGIREKILKPDHPDIAVCLNNLAVVYHEWHRREEADSFFKRALFMSEKSLGKEHPYTQICIRNMAEKYQNQSIDFAGLVNSKEDPIQIRRLPCLHTINGLDSPHTKNDN